MIKDVNARKFILFPIGFIACPDPSSHPELYNTLRNIIPVERWRNGSQNSSNDNLWICPGYPIAAYPNLEYEGEWTRAISVEGQVTVPIELRQTFYSHLEIACESFERAGVCHLDIRLANIYFRIKGIDQVEIKVVDWDYSNLLNCKLESGFQELCKNSYVFPNHFTVASREWHQYMLEDLKRYL